MNAREFVLALADQLTEQGREVEVKEDDEMIHIFSNSRSIFETAIGAGAYKSSRSNRWKFLGLRAYPLTAPEIVERTRRGAEITVKVYGKSRI